ncbi:MAG TPA: glycoside hydrolase family 47 protein [Candidatus Acidoferrales bacterium]|nr:glycoside hydrolase family 47 protein [Candidatus Acidoferrales bacterium]
MSITTIPGSDDPAAAASAVFPDRVRAEFLHAWNGYKRYAWGHDALMPLSKTYADWYATSLLMTPVDSFDTMLLMGLTAEAAEAKELILSRLEFDLDMEVQHFEVAIRILGGLISAQQLDRDPRFLKLACDLADRLLPAFDSNTGMPYRFVNLKTHKARCRFTNPAEVGTSILEYGTLSRLTGNQTYFDAAKRALVALYDRRSRIGLVGTMIDVESGRWLVKDSHVGGRIDSYYEYLLKGALLFDDAELWGMWRDAIASVNAYVADESNGLWYGHVHMNSGKRRATYFGALYAFFPAVLALGGDLARAGRLEDSCYKMWTLFGAAPEVLDYKAMKVVLGSYQLRPEIIESAYYLYHYTGDEKYRRMGAAIFNSIIERCKTEAGFAALADVRTGVKTDAMESYLLAEVMKYSYLLFAPPVAFDFEKVIFNTEAHPIWRNGASSFKKRSHQTATHSGLDQT